MSDSCTTSAFENLPEEKRERIYAAAARILGRDGLDRARVGDIAREAGVSHGSMFSYFPTKELLVRALVQRGAELQRRVFAGEAGTRPGEESRGALERAASRLEAAFEEARRAPELIALWLALSLPENAGPAAEAFPMEREALEYWASLVRAGQDEGSLRRDLDPRALAFLLDAAAAQLMKSRASAHEQAKFATLFPDETEGARCILETLAALLATREGSNREEQLGSRG